MGMEEVNFQSWVQNMFNVNVLLRIILGVSGASGAGGLKRGAVVDLG